MAPIALGDDGNRVLMRRDAFGFGNHETLELWTIRGKTIRRMLSWTAYDDGWKPNRDVNWAEFVDADHLLTSSANGKIAMWDLKTAQPLWHFQTTGGATPCLSGDRKTLGFCTSDRVGLFDIANRKVIAMASTPRTLTWPVTAFSPTGKRLACIAQNRILVWDTNNGKLLADFETPGINLLGGIGFPDDRFLLCGNKFLVELEKQLKLWEYSGAERMQTVGNLTVVALAPHNAPGALLAIDLPHKEARDFLAKALTQPDIFVFREGTKVKLDVRRSSRGRPGPCPPGLNAEACRHEMSGGRQGDHFSRCKRHRSHGTGCVLHALGPIQGDGVFHGVAFRLPWRCCLVRKRFQYSWRRHSPAGRERRGCPT